MYSELISLDSRLIFQKPLREHSLEITVPVQPEQPIILFPEAGELKIAKMKDLQCVCIKTAPLQF